MRMHIFILALVISLSLSHGTILADYAAVCYASEAVVSGNRTYIPINKRESSDYWRRMIPLILDAYETIHSDIWKTSPDSNGIRMYKTTVQKAPEPDGAEVFIHGLWIEFVSHDESSKYFFGAKNK